MAAFDPRLNGARGRSWAIRVAKTEELAECLRIEKHIGLFRGSKGRTGRFHRFNSS